MTDFQTEHPDLPPEEAVPPLDGTLPPAQQPASTGGFSPLFTGLSIAAALFVGAALGYSFGRTQSPPAQAVIPAAASSPQAVANVGSAPANPSTQPAQQSAPAAAPTEGSPTPTIMDFVLSDARHFQGSDTAPITLIEFSDFK